MDYRKHTLVLVVLALLFTCFSIQPVVAYNSSIMGTGEVGVIINVHDWPIRPGTTGGTDIKNMLEAENGGDFSGTVTGKNNVSFIPVANNISVGGKTYPSAYVAYTAEGSTNTDNNLSSAGKEFSVSFKVPTNMDFGLRLKGNRDGNVTVSVVAEDGTTFTGTGGAYSANGNEAYIGANSSHVFTQSGNTAQWFYAEDMKNLGEYVTVTMTGTMGNDRLFTTAYLQCQIYYNSNTSGSS